jgi:hypothetical protein
MAAIAARLHQVGPRPAETILTPSYVEPKRSGLDGAERLLDRAVAAGAVALLMAFLLGLLVGEYWLVWRLLFAPWADSMGPLMP